LNRVRAGIAGAAAIAALVGGTVVVRSMSDDSDQQAMSTGSTTSTAPARTDAAPAAPPTQPPTTPAPAPSTTAAPAPTGAGATGGGERTAAAAHGWQLVAADEFDGNAVDTSRWTLYEGPGNGGVGLRNPDAVSQSDGELRITGRGDVSGGMNWNGGRTYGRWEVRARMDRGNGYSPAILLWPSSGNWPAEGEIDLSEIPRGDRSESHFTMHWGVENSQTGFPSSGDFSQWHTFAIEWQPDHVTFFLDGEAVYTNDDPAAIPRNNMHLAIQNDVGPHDGWIPARDASTPPEVSLHVDWVRLYA
jgi:beta-glucanase (GH16 family)